MVHLIDKDAIVTEIKKRIKYYQAKNQKWGVAGYAGRVAEGEEILSYINTLEVKEEFKIGETKIYLDDDGGEPPYDGKQWLDLSCTEYEIPSNKFKDGDNVEIIIRKTQKGE